MPKTMSRIAGDHKNKAGHVHGWAFDGLHVEAGGHYLSVLI